VTLSLYIERVEMCRSVDTEPVEVLFYIGVTFHLRGKTEGSFKPTFKVKLSL
jgi:hypothetical protein